MKSQTLGLIAVAFLSLTGGCNESPAPVSSLGEGVLARVDGVDITASEFLSRVRDMQARIAPQERRPLDRQGVLNAMIEQKVLARLAIQAGMDREPDVLKLEPPFKEARLAESFRKRLIKNVPGPAIVRMEMKDFPNTAFVDPVKRRQLKPEYLQYFKIQWNYVHSEVEKAKIDLKVEKNLAALNAISE